MQIKKAKVEETKPKANKRVAKSKDNNHKKAHQYCKSRFRETR